MTERVYEGCVSIALNRPSEVTKSLGVKIGGELEDLLDAAGFKFVEFLFNMNSLTLAPHRKQKRNGKKYLSLRDQQGRMYVEVRDRRVYDLFGDQCFSATEVPVHVSGKQSRLRIDRLPVNTLKDARERFEFRRALA